MPETKAFTSNASLLDFMDEYLKDNGHTPLSGGARRKVAGVLLNLLSRTFGLFVRQGRESGKGVRGIVGVRQRELDKDQHIPRPQVKGLAKPVECKDPFEQHPITAYSELVEGFVVSDTVSCGANEIVDVSLTNDQMDTSSAVSPGKGTSLLGLLGAQKGFRNAVIGDLTSTFSKYGFVLKEVDLESCHTQILVDLDLGAEGIKELLNKGANLWEHMIGKLDHNIQQEFGFKFLKGCAKRLCYKALQGGRINTAEKIKTTLVVEEGLAAKSLMPLAESFHRNTLLAEFDLLNKAIMARYKRHKQLRIYAPIDPFPYTLINKGASQRSSDWYTANACRVASQIVTGVEMMQIILMLEQMQKLRLPWLPVSLHHDGCALLVEECTFEENREKLILALKERLAPSYMQIKGLEFTPYDPVLVNPEQVECTLRIPDNRII